MRHLFPAALVVLVCTGMPLSGQASTVTPQEVSQLVGLFNAYPYPATKWGGWLKSSYRMLARQCMQLGMTGLPAADSDKAAALTEQGLSDLEILYVQGTLKEPVPVPAGYRTPENLAQACKTAALVPVRPYCWPILQGTAPSYTATVECALVTAGSPKTGITLWAAQPLTAKGDWVSVAQDNRAKGRNDEIRLKLTVPQLPGSEVVGLPGKPLERSSATPTSLPQLPDLVVPGLGGPAAIVPLSQETHGTVSRPENRTPPANAAPTPEQPSKGASSPTSPLAQPETTTLPRLPVSKASNTNR